MRAHGIIVKYHFALLPQDLPCVEKWFWPEVKPELDDEEEEEEDKDEDKNEAEEELEVCWSVKWEGLWTEEFYNDIKSNSLHIFDTRLFD